jgi:hypothetical protein
MWALKIRCALRIYFLENEEKLRRFDNIIAHWSKPVRQFLRNLQTLGAFIVAFTREKCWMTIKKSLFCHWPLIPNFFITYLPILVRCKTKGAVGVVCVLRFTAHLTKCQIANYWMRWRGIFKGLSQDGGRADFSIKKTPRLSLFNDDLSN